MGVFSTIFEVNDIYRSEINNVRYMYVMQFDNCVFSFIC